MTQPTCAVLLIGDELLSGRTQDANFNHIAVRMGEIGIHMKEARIVPDNEYEIIEALKALKEKYTYVFTTGGIGPTHDDITVQTLARLFQVPVLRDEKTYQAFKDYYKEDLKEATLKMAHFPKGAELIANPMSIAPGFRMENIYCMAGIPAIMRVMLEAVIPTLDTGKVMLSKSIDVYTGESTISKDFESLQEKYPRAELGSYPFRNEAGKPCTSLVIRTTDPHTLESAYTDIKTMLKHLMVRYD